MPRRDCLTCFVRGSNCFCHLPLEAVTSLQNIGRCLRLNRGEHLFHEGDSGDHVYLICEGHVKLTASSSDGRLLIVRVAHPGDVLGLAAVLGGSHQKLAAEAVDSCEVKAIRRDDFLGFAERFHTVNRNAARASAQEYEGAVLSARRLALSGSASGKLASVLVDFAQASSPEGDSAAEFSMPLTHEELGSMARLSRETATDLLSKFRNEGLIQQSGNRMQLCEPKKLEALFNNNRARY